MTKASVWPKQADQVDAIPRRDRNGLNRAPLTLIKNPREIPMKKFTMATACFLVMAAAGGAIAQTNQPAPGASGQGEVGQSSRGPATKGMTTGKSSNLQNEAGSSNGIQAPSSGGTNTTNMGSQAGGGGAGGAGGSGGK